MRACRTVEETQTLIKGVEDCGGGKWADIKKRKYKSIENRSAVSGTAHLCSCVPPDPTPPPSPPPLSLAAVTFAWMVRHEACGVTQDLASFLVVADAPCGLSVMVVVMLLLKPSRHLVMRACMRAAQVDLKDKWRNLMRLAVLPAAALRTRCAKRRELPLDLLVKVRPTSWPKLASQSALHHYQGWFKAALDRCARLTCLWHLQL